MTRPDNDTDTERPAIAQRPAQPDRPAQAERPAQADRHRTVPPSTRLWCRLQSRLLAAGGGQAGQSTVEYALVLLGAAAVALALVAWVTRSDMVQRLFDAVVGRILSQAG